MTENQIAKQILDGAFVVHTKLGPGLFESVYEVVLAHELRKRGLTVERQKPMPIVYDGVRFDEAKWEGDCGIEICGSNFCDSREAGSYSIAPERIETWLAHQFRRGAFEEWDQANH